MTLPLVCIYQYHLYRVAMAFDLLPPPFHLRVITRANNMHHTNALVSLAVSVSVCHFLSKLGQLHFLSIDLNPDCIGHIV